MRLSRLDLVRYGKFTGRTLDFGAAEPGRPDLHLVYGPNEAGKSTAFAAFLDLLFGIRATKEPNYAFLHPYPTMRVGACLDLSGGTREVARIRRAQATLLDGDDRPLDEGLIAAELGGIGRDAYRTMFSLDDDSIELGGDEILASRGDLGQILFSGSAGAAGLSQALDAMRAEADGFFRPGAHKTGLNDLKAELDALKDERERIDTQAVTYKRRVEERDRAAAACDAALAARAAAAARRDEIGRLLAALPRLATLRDRRRSLAPLLALPEPPKGWVDEWPDLERDELRLAAESRGIAGEAEVLARERDGIVVEEAVLALGPAHDGLATARAAALTAGKDLPRRRPQLAEVEGAVAAALVRLGRPADQDPETVALPVALVGTLRALVAEHSGVVGRRDDAQREAEAAARDLAAAEEALTQAGGGDGPALARLDALVHGVRDADPAGRHRAAGKARAAAQNRLAEAVRALVPWSGTADQLAATPLPAQRDADAWAADLADAEREVLRWESEGADLGTARDALRAEVDTLGRLAGPVSDAEALALRARREQAWAVHRARLDAASAEDFEDAMRRDDATVAARFGQATDVARLKEASLALATLEARLAGAVDRAATARRRAAAPLATMATALAPFDPPFPTPPTPAGLAAWLSRTGPALRARVELSEAAEAAVAAEHEVSTWRDRLAAALVTAGLAVEREAGLDALVASARVAADRGALLAARATEVAQAQRRAADRAAAFDRAEATESDWQARWAAACGSCWLGEGGAPLPPAAVAEVLDVLAELAPELRSRADLRHRIAAMEADQVQFAARIAGLAADLGEIPETDDPDRVLDHDAALGRRIGAARAAVVAREACRKKLVDVEGRRSAIAQAIAANRARGDAFRAFFGVDTLADVGTRLRLCGERDRLRGEASALESEICGGLRVPDLATAEAWLAGLDAGALETERDAVAGRYDAADLDLRTHHASRITAEAALDAVGGDDAVARIEARRQVVLLDIEEQARRFLKLRGGIAAAEQALAAYRDRHRSAMLDAASKAFATISRGNYTGLAAQPSDKGEILIAQASDGKTKQATDLSKGTRFQLYLALRAAGYGEFVRTRRTAVPFVADDIMETFDDFRAEEAFRLFAGMAELGQVIYLTHHRHLIDIARAACPTVAVHRLDAA